ncbi:5-oxoprolinase subunit PxpA [Flagellimonas sp.]|uniref:5-oxoprolinase subunit PxpA n=1 Tax=Flagellimonas sp. TaxID=2058762 RepID=UPI003B5B9DFB
MENWTIDINCDVGEGIGNEADLFPLISSCNIACGGHAGDVDSISEIIKLAKIHNVKIGAHPSYPDKANFGREVMNISNSELKQSIIHQVSTFKKILEREEGQFHHIKAHGALYNQTAKDEVLAMIYLDAIGEYKDTVPIYVPYKSVVAEKATDLGFRIMFEAFGDRNYNDDLSLVSRKMDNSLIKQPEKVLDHILPIIQEGNVVSVKNKRIAIQAETICIHGDTSSALEILMYLSKELPNHKVQLEK